LLCAHSDRVFPQPRARLYAAELILAIEHLHSLNVVYRDLKVRLARRHTATATAL
jgi:serine/threonine protein kinase